MGGERGRSGRTYGEGRMGPGDQVGMEVPHLPLPLFPPSTRHTQMCYKLHVQYTYRGSDGRREGEEWEDIWRG